jgi:hypothetical protein
MFRRSSFTIAIATLAVLVSAYANGIVGQRVVGNHDVDVEHDAAYLQACRGSC